MKWSNLRCAALLQSFLGGQVYGQDNNFTWNTYKHKIVSIIMGAVQRFIGFMVGGVAIFSIMKSLDTFLYDLDEK